MPMSKAGRKIKKNLEEQYGKKRGKQIFYAMENKGKIPGMAKGGMVKCGASNPATQKRTPKV